MEDTLCTTDNILKELGKIKETNCPHCKKAIDPALTIDQRLKVLIGTPCMGKIEPEIFDQFIDWAMYLKELEWKLPIKFFFGSVGDVLTPWARERIAEQAVENGFDYLLFVDDDMLFSKDIFERLFKNQVDVVAPLMFMRHYPHSPVIYRVKQGYDTFRHQGYYKTEIIEDYPSDTLLKVDATGMGICLIKVSILGKVPQPWFMNTQGTGEDVYFTERATKAGFGVYVDTTIKDVIHLGVRKRVDEQTFRRVKNGKETIS